MLYQTSGSWTRDSTNMSIGEAQLDICAADANVMMASPAYAVTDKGGHLDANGYRWLGMQFGKVLHRAIDRRQNWRPLQPLSVTLSGTFLRADFRVEPAASVSIVLRGFISDDVCRKRIQSH